MNQPTLFKRKEKDPFKMSEHELMNWTISRLSLAQWKVWRQNAGKMPIRNAQGGIERFIHLGEKGLSDVIGISPHGLFAAFEIKVKPNKPTPQQVEFLGEVKKRGGIGAVIYATEEVETVIAEYNKLTADWSR